MNKAAFYDLDGTLLSCNLVNMYAYYARNDRNVVKSVYQLGKVVLSLPLLFGLDLYSRSLFNVFSFRVGRMDPELLGVCLSQEARFSSL